MKRQWEEKIVLTLVGGVISTFEEVYADWRLRWWSCWW